jgi:pimeloyl-ACP methyl ester carboxylesterase
VAATRPEVAARLLESWGIIDVTDTLQYVEAPTLVTHARGDARVPFEQRRVIAAGIPGSRFIEVESRNHILIEHEPAWERFKSVVSEFLGSPPAALPGATVPATGAIFGELTARAGHRICA